MCFAPRAPSGRLRAPKFRALLTTRPTLEPPIGTSQTLVPIYEAQTLDSVVTILDFRGKSAQLVPVWAHLPTDRRMIDPSRRIRAQLWQGPAGSTQVHNRPMHHAHAQALNRAGLHYSSRQSTANHTVIDAHAHKIACACSRAPQGLGPRPRSERASKSQPLLDQAHTNASSQESRISSK